MLKESFFEYILKENKNPTIIMDLSGRVLAFNQEFRYIIPELKKDLFFTQYFVEDDYRFFNQLIEDIKDYDSIIFKRKNFIFSDGSLYEILCSRFVYEFQTFIFCSLNGINSLRNRFVPTDCSLSKLPLNDKLNEQIEKLCVEYPYSFINKAKLSNEIENFSLKIWVKNKEGKLVIVNSAYAKKLGYEKDEIEGIDENTVSKITGAEFSREIDSFIFNSSSNTKIFSEVFILPDKPLRTFKIPIINQNQVNGIITLTEDIIINKTQISETFDDEYVSLLTIDENNKIVSSNELIYEVLSLDKSVDIYNKDITNLFDEDFLSEIERYRSNFRERKSHKFIYLERKNSQVENEYHISLQKLFSGNFVIGIAISFKLNNKKNNKNQDVMNDSILQLIPQPIFVYEVDNLKFLYVNDSALALYGYSREEFLQMDLTDLYAPEDIQTLIEAANNRSKDNEFTGPWRQKRRDGKSIIVEISKSVFDFNNKRAHVNFIKDLTETIEANKQMNYYKSVFDNTSDLIFVIDQDGFISYTNDSSVTALGYNRDELDKRPIISLIADDYRARFNSMVLNSNTKSPQRLDVELKNSSNDRIAVNIVTAPIINQNGERESIILIVKVNIENQNQPQVFSNNEEKLPNALDAGFLAHLFHEILTPINVIIGFAQELSESIIDPSEEQSEAIEIITENQRLLMKIMDNASEYVALESKKIELNPEKVVFVELIDDLQNNLRELTESKNKSFSYGKISSSLSIQTDKHKLLTLLNLFFTFAINTTKEEKIYLSAYAFNNEEGIISIKDNNSGITSVLIKKMKEILVADEEVVRRNYGISRFTLRLLRKLLYLLSGKVEEITKAGKIIELGIRFPLVFKEVILEQNIEIVSEQPAKKEVSIVEEEPVIEKPKVYQKEEKLTFNYEEIKRPTPDSIDFTKAQVEEVPKITIPAKPVITDFNLANYSCMYVEDQSDSQILFKSQMRDLKNIQFAASFEDAIPVLEKNKFDFIVMDMNLQGEYNGLDALRIIQRMPNNKSVPVIAVTAYVLPGDREKFITAGFSDFISKPVMRDKLVDVLKRIFA